MQVVYGVYFVSYEKVKKGLHFDPKNDNFSPVLEPSQNSLTFL